MGGAVRHAHVKPTTEKKVVEEQGTALKNNHFAIVATESEDLAVELSQQRAQRLPHSILAADTAAAKR